VWLGRTEFQDLIRPQAAAEAVETLQSAGVGTDNLAATALGPTLPGLAADIAYPADTNTAATDLGSDTPVPATVGTGRFAGSDVPKLAQTNVSNFSSVTTIPLKVAVADVQRRRARSRRFKRLAAASALALMGGIASMPFITSGSSRIPPATAGNPAPAAPVVAIPAPEPGSNDNSHHVQDSTGASVAAPNDPADGLTLSGQSAVSTPHSTQSPNRRTSRSKPPASMMAPPAPRPPAIPAEAYTWSGMDALSARDQSRAHLRPESPPHP
jgi:hypothetical protein